MSKFAICLWIYAGFFGCAVCRFVWDYYVYYVDLCVYCVRPHLFHCDFSTGMCGRFSNYARWVLEDRFEWILCWIVPPIDNYAEAPMESRIMPQIVLASGGRPNRPTSSNSPASHCSPTKARTFPPTTESAVCTVYVIICRISLVYLSMGGWSTGTFPASHSEWRHARTAHIFQRMPR